MQPDTWRPGMPNAPCLCEVRPTRAIYLEFVRGQRECWPEGEVRVAHFPVQVGPAPWHGLVSWPRVGLVILTDESPVEWRPIEVPSGL